MFNIGFSELIIVLLIAFLVVGPKDLPKVARWLGRAVKRIRQMIRELKKETGWDELEKEWKDTKEDVGQTFNDLKKDMDVSPELKDASAQWNKSVKSVKSELNRSEKEIRDGAKKE
ncbi:MAG: twin-arginine translocase subunit TatB [Clostridia bacterium]|nr:twin-arginine translocase subunit TatB [Clostridia bacterium]